MRIYIDLDGTICDIKKAVKEYRENNKSEEGTIQYKYPWSVPGFFSNLDPIDNSIESVLKLSKKYDVWFLSRPSFKNVDSYSDKAIWVNKFFGYEFQKKLILCGDKSLLIGKVLVDDSNNANQNKFNGVWIQIFSEYHPDWNSVMNRIEEIGDLPINSL